MSTIKNASELLFMLATKAGIPADNQYLKNLLANEELTKANVHADLAKALDENLLSLEAAQDNHPQISGKYKAQALSPIDKKMEALIEALELDEAGKTELKGIKSSYERFEKLTAKLQELSAKKDGADTGKEKTALQKQIDDLLGKLQNEKTTYEQQIQKLEAERTNDKIGFELRAILGGIKTKFDDLDADVRNTTIGTIINKALQDKDAELTFDDKGSFIVRKKDGTSLVNAGHTKYTPQSFVDEVLGQQKLRAVSNAATTTTTTTPTNTSGAVSDQPATNGTNQSVVNLNMEAINGLQS